MGDATVNGDMPSSSFLSHVSSYPLVSDSISAFKSNPYGAKSIDLTNAGYSKFVKPTFPYLQTPAAYAKPYVAKADAIGDSLLTKVDEKVPMLKSETSELQSKASDLAGWPMAKATETKDWVFSTYSKEYKKCGGDGYVAGGKAMITSSLVLSSDMLNWLGSFLQAKKGEVEKAVKEKTNN
jgi:hypothetical protein